MKLILPLLIVTIAVLGCANRGSRGEQTDPLVISIGSKFDFSDAVKAKVGKFPAKWNGINISKISQSMVVVYLEYRQKPSSMNEVESDSKRVAQATVDTLIGKQWNPREKGTMVFVHAQMPENGSTGSNLIRQFGKATYSPYTDSINFEPK